MSKLGSMLARSLNPSIGSTPEILQTCNLICQYASTIQRLAVAYCNRPLSSYESKKDAYCEARIRSLVETLPQVDGEAIGVEFQGDPRGACVKLIMPDGRGDSWGGDGRICVPTPNY